MPKFKNLRALAVYRALTKGSELVQSALPDKELGQLVLNISQGCNLGCPYCFADKGQYGSNEKGFMSFETAKLSIDAFISKYNAIKSVKFFGGEPSLNFRLIQEVCHYFDHLVKIGRLSNVPYFIIVTNLTILTHEMLDYYSKYKFRITVSLDGPEEINDTFRMFDNRTGSFHLVDKNIRVLKDKIGKDNMGIESVYSPQHVQNNMSIVDLHKYFLDRYGMESITIHPLVENEYSKYIYAYFPQKIVEQYYNTVFDVSCDYGKYLVRLVAEGKEMWLVYSLLDEMSSKVHADLHCGLGINMLSVHADGSVYPCYTLTNKEEFKMANVTDGRIFTDKFTKVQFTLLNNRKSDNPYCANCDIVETCHACPGGMFGKWKDMTRPIDLLCHYYVGLREGLLLGLDEVLSDDAKSTTFRNTLDRIRTSSDVWSIME